VRARGAPFQVPRRLAAARVRIIVTWIAPPRARAVRVLDFALGAFAMRRCVGFTLVELLVVMAVVGLLVGLLLPAVQSSRQSARIAHCASNLRQVGLATNQFCDTHRDRWPQTTHTAEADPVTGKYDEAWIYTIAPYMEDVDAIRICPSDLAGELRQRGKGTSYTLNGWLSREARPSFESRRKLAALSKTIVAFELSEEKDKGAMKSQQPSDVDPFNDHVHSFSWFSSSNIAAKKVFQAIQAEVAVDRHQGTSHFLYADGHVELISSQQVGQWADEAHNFAKPQGF
jgi:prepilin-type processing-associated H-X9-DG protein/prepilin-type N-terminal cleavage/methylation domain-containing protein